MAMTVYESLANDKVKFLQGTQSDLNKYLPVSRDVTKRGQAEEGAFYLTTDTHRLYVGRKVDEAGNTDNGLIFPVQVSAGITTVADTGELANLALDGEKGDMYYIQDGNVLAVLEIAPDNTRSWVQVNPPTGIKTFIGDILQAANSNTAQLNTIVSTEANNGASLYAKHDIEGGQNITLTSTPADLEHGIYSKLRIDADRYTLTTDATPQNSHNLVQLGLKKNNLSVFNSVATIQGNATAATYTEGQVYSTVTATSDGSGNITLEGPRFIRLSSEGYPTGNLKTGFQLKMSYYNPVTQQDANISGDLDPGIRIGYSGNINNVSHEPTVVKFRDGNAILDVYTQAEVNDKIAEAISASLSTANAMNYAGTITSYYEKTPPDGTSLAEKIAANGAHIGDTYKVVLPNNTTYITLDSGNAYNGDLIILGSSDGTETGPNQTIASEKLVYDIVPAGDEQVLRPAFVPSADGSENTVVLLQDTKNNTSSILRTEYIGGDYINITSASSGNSIAITIDHDVAPARTDVSNLNLNSTISTDTFGANGIYEFFALRSPSDIITDTYGHVVGVQGSKISLKHNGITSSSTEYFAIGAHVGQAIVGLTQKIGDSVGLRTTFSSNTLTFGTSSQNIDGVNTPTLNVDLLWGSF